MLDVALLNFMVRRFGKSKLYECLEPQRCEMRVLEVPIALLRPHEGVEEGLLEAIMRDLSSCGYVKYPVVVDVRTLTVLDGHHRVEALRRLGFEAVPAFLVDYLRDYVDVHPLRKDIPVSKQSVLERALGHGGLYPPKTTRHVYHGITVPAIFRPLSELRGRGFFASQELAPCLH